MTFLIIQALYSSVFPVINEVYINYLNSITNTQIVTPNGFIQINQNNSLIQTVLIYCNDILYKLRLIPLFQPIFHVVTYLSVYWVIGKVFKISFKYIPGINQYEIIKRKLEFLTERIDTVVDEEISPTAETNQSIINISFGRKKKKNYPLAGVREVEYELIEILGHFNRILKPFTLEFVIVFDELDKVDPESDIKEKEEDIPSFTDKNQSNAFSGGASSRERKENVLRLLANMKHFISTARAKFIFISGRELYDAYLAGLSDREFAISSVFCGAIYVESFLTSNRAQMDVSSMTEQYLCKMLLPKDYLEKIIKEKYYRYGIITQEVPSLKWYSRYLYEQMQEEKKRDELTQFEEWELNNSIMFLRYFSIYLTHISNGSPQKILSYFRMYIRTQDNLYRKNIATPTIYGLNSSMKKKKKMKMSEKYVLTFNYVNQQKIAFIFYMAYPTMQAIINNATQYGDKLLISASFLMNHIYKYHSNSFSWRNLEQAPELLEVYRTPELRTFLHSILSFMVHTHMTNIPSGLYNFKFRKSISNEIAIFSKLSEEVSAIFNFTLDESLSVKKHYTRLMKHYTELLERGNSDKEHYSILLSRIHQVLGDLQLTDENYLESALEYRSSIVYLKRLLLQHKKSEQFISGDIMLPLIRNMLKLGLTYERRKTNNSAYVVYYELICMLIDFRYVDETKLGMKLKVKKTQDWRDKTYVLYKENSLEKGDSPSLSLTDQDETREFYNFQKEIESQLLPVNKGNNQEHENYYEIEGDQLILGLSRILTPEKTNIIFRLSLLEDLRLVYQAILAKLFVLEKVELGGITKVHVDVAESEFRYLYRVTNIQDKFIILADFFRRLAEILYYKNGLMNRNMDLFVTGLYFWGYEFNTDIEEYCRINNIKSAQQQHIEKSLNEIKWATLNIKPSGLKSTNNYEEQ